MAGRSKPPSPVLFLHTGWARRYRGDPGDLPQGKFGYIEDGNSDMGETLNFKVYRGRCYGYAPHYKVDLGRLAKARGVDHVDGALVIWTATNPDGSGRYIVGWYKNARVYAQMQDIRPDRERPGIIAEASATDCHLVPVDERKFFVPSMLTGWPGIKSAYYPGSRFSKEQMDVLLKYVGGAESVGFYEGPPGPPGNGGGWGDSTPEDRKEVEEAAVKVVTDHYEDDGWTVKRVDNENRGWDLNVFSGRRLLHVEVKGRDGAGAVELTPNEYKKMQDPKLRMRYRLAIVLHALSASPKLTIFSYAPGRDAWVSDKDDVLALQEATSAVASF